MGGIVKGNGWTAIVLGPEPAERVGDWVRNDDTWSRGEGGSLRAEVKKDDRGAKCALTYEGRPVGSILARTPEAAMKSADYWFNLHAEVRAKRSVT